MANHEHLAKLNEGINSWNQWRMEHPDIKPDLSESDLKGMDLSGFDLTNTNFYRAVIAGTNFTEADLSHSSMEEVCGSEANFTGAILRDTYFYAANIREANFTDADMTEANFGNAILNGSNFTNAKLNETSIMNSELQDAQFINTKIFNSYLGFSIFYSSDFSNAELQNVNLLGAVFLDTIMDNTSIIDCKVWGVSIWRVDLTNTIQRDLVITAPFGDDQKITVDNIEIAQFIYLLLYNEKIRYVIDEITSKIVLILGRFTPERKIVLDTIRDELRKQNLIPVLFDFQKPNNRDIIETVFTLAGMARFVIVDITDAKMVIQELDNIVPNLPSVPVQPIILSSSESIWAGYSHLKRKSPNLLEMFRYDDLDNLKKSLKNNVIKPADDLRRKLMET
jgi:uncharacterized protein YjbI with pentapeptide repeats